MESNRLMYGSIGAGILAGLIMLILFGWISLFGWLAAGLVAGFAARGSARGFLAGLISGIIVSIITLVLSLFVPVSTLNTYLAYMGNTYIQNTVFKPELNILGYQLVALVRKLAVDVILIPAVGGFIGGSILSNGYFVEEVEDRANEEREPVNTKAQIIDVDDEKEEVPS